MVFTEINRQRRGEKSKKVEVYRQDLEKQERCGVMAHWRLTEPRVRME